MKFLKVFLHPVTQLNLLVVGFLVIVQLLHTHAHYSMEVDADSYVYQFLKKNPDKCNSIKNDY